MAQSGLVLQLKAKKDPTRLFVVGWRLATCWCLWFGFVVVIVFVANAEGTIKIQDGGWSICLFQINPISNTPPTHMRTEVEVGFCSCSLNCSLWFGWV